MVVSPANGTIVKIFNTGHAFCLETETGAEIVVHIGIDTVKLNGQGFTRLVEEGTTVVAGQPVLELDLAYLNANAHSMINQLSSVILMTTRGSRCWRVIQLLPVKANYLRFVANNLFEMSRIPFEIQGDTVQVY